MPGKGLKAVLKFQISPAASKHCVAGNILSASYEFSAPALHHSPISSQVFQVVSFMQVLPHQNPLFIYIPPLTCHMPHQYHLPLFVDLLARGHMNYETSY
jgi:hypothetical protein